jgi:hypothetical protein
MHKNLFGLAAILFGVAAISASLPHAQAYPTGPNVTGGQHPWVDFAGALGPYATTTVYTVPSGRVFVLTGFKSNAGNIVDIYEGTTLKVHGYSGALGDSLIGGGRGRITFGSETEVRLKNNHSGDTYMYTIQGYLAHPGS